jgi:hypothetical protein
MSQHVLVSNHPINNLRQINMFLKQVAHNATTWLGTLDELTNFRDEYEQTKENMFETNNHL